MASAIRCCNDTGNGCHLWDVEQQVIPFKDLSKGIFYKDRYLQIFQEKAHGNQAPQTLDCLTGLKQAAIQAGPGQNRNPGFR